MAPPRADRIKQKGATILGYYARNRVDARLACPFLSTIGSNRLCKVLMFTLRPALTGVNDDVWADDKPDGNSDDSLPNQSGG